MGNPSTSTLKGSFFDRMAPVESGLQQGLRRLSENPNSFYYNVYESQVNNRPSTFGNGNLYGLSDNQQQAQITIQNRQYGVPARLKEDGNWTTAQATTYVAPPLMGEPTPKQNKPMQKVGIVLANPAGGWNGPGLDARAEKTERITEFGQKLGGSAQGSGFGRSLYNIAHSIEPFMSDVVNTFKGQNETPKPEATNSVVDNASEGDLVIYSNPFSGNMYSVTRKHLSQAQKDSLRAAGKVTPHPRTGEDQYEFSYQSKKLSPANSLAPTVPEPQKLVPSKVIVYDESVSKKNPDGSITYPIVAKKDTSVWESTMDSLIKNYNRMEDHRWGATPEELEGFNKNRKK